ncbi:MAG: glycine zipper domain-containing protein [Nitrospirota bacterium]
MKRMVSTIIVVVFLISSLGGCASTSSTGEKTAAGAGLGALMGGAIGYLTTGKASGALAGAAIGAAVGGLAGYVIGKHDEGKYKSAQQIYKENPQFAGKGSTLPPTVVKLKPYISTQKGNKITAIKTEQPMKLCMEYDIAVGKANTQKTVNKEDIILDNYLVMPDGTETPHSQRHPAKDPSVDGYKDCITIEKGLPNGIPDDNYTHVASVKLGDKETKKDQKVLVAKSDGEIKIYASNRRN